MIYWGKNSPWPSHIIGDSFLTAVMTSCWGHQRVLRFDHMWKMNTEVLSISGDVGALCNVEVVAFSCCAGAVKPSYICQVRLSSHSGLFVCCVDVIIAAYFMYRIADGADNS